LHRYSGYEDGSLSKHTFIQQEEGYDPFTGQKGWKRLKKALSQDRRWSGVATPSYSPDGLYVAVLVSFMVSAIIGLQLLTSCRSWGGILMCSIRERLLLNTVDTLVEMSIVCVYAAVKL
jgi:hypothetical protein